jgi:hypothetical protein
VAEKEQRSGTPAALQALNADEASGTALISNGLETLVDRTKVELLPSCHGWELQYDEPAGIPVTFVYLMGSPAGKVAGAGGLKLRFDLAHEVLVSLGIADLDVEHHIGCHSHLAFNSVIVST